MPKIQRTETDNTFCCPAACSALLGIPVSQAIEELKKTLGDQQITGVYHPLILKMLKDYGYRWQEVSESHRTKSKGLYLIVYKGHVGVIENDLYIDNWFPNGIKTNDLRFPKRQKQMIFKVWKEKV